MEAHRRPMVVALAMVLVFLSTACASSKTAPAAVAPADVRSLAGMWDGFASPTAGGSIPIEVQVQPDGTYVSRMGASSGTGAFRMVNGRIVTEGHLSGSAYGSAGQSTAVVKQRDGRTVLSGQGRNDAGPFNYELTKRN